MYPYILLVFVVVFFAGNILVGKAIQDLPPFTIAFIRLCIATIVLFPIGIRGAMNYKERYWRHLKPFLLITITGITFFNTFIYGALQFTSATNVSVLETFIPVMTVLLSVIFLHERLRFTQWIGVAVSLIGALWVITGGNITVMNSTHGHIGDVIMLGGVLSWAVYTIAVKNYMHLFPGYGSLFVMSGVSVVILTPFVVSEWLVVGSPSFDWSNGLGLLYLGIFPSVIALAFYNRAIELTSASKASVFLNFLPVVTMVGAAIWLNEEITWIKALGALAVIVGVLLTTRTRKRQGGFVS